jgi:hypothetical protein
MRPRRCSCRVRVSGGILPRRIVVKATRSRALRSFLCAGLVLTLPTLALPQGKSGSLPPSQYLEYRVSWNGIPAANATVRISTDNFSGDLGYVVEASVQTNDFVDIFYSYRGRVRTTFLADELFPLRYTYQERVNSRPAIAWVDFDRRTRTAEGVYVSKKGKRKTYELDGNVFVDPVTAVFRARRAQPKTGEQISQHVFTGEKHYHVILTVTGEEVVEVPAGRFAALVLKPTVYKMGKDKPHKKLREATIWVTRDLSHVPLKIRSRVFIGSVNVDLVYNGAPAPEHAGQVEAIAEADLGVMSAGEAPLP